MSEILANVPPDVQARCLLGVRKLMTPQTLPLRRRIEVLLNTLVGEHHVRRALLLEACELMATAGRTLEHAHSAALQLLAALDTGADVDDFDASVQRISRSMWSAPKAAGDDARASEDAVVAR